VYRQFLNKNKKAASVMRSRPVAPSEREANVSATSLQM